MKPVKRTLVGVIALGTISLIRAVVFGPLFAHENTAPQPVTNPQSNTAAHPDLSAQQLLAETVQAITGAVDTASAATPCTGGYIPSNGECLVPTPVPTATPKPTAAPTATPRPTTAPTATPKPVATPTPAPTPIGSKSAPAKPNFQASSTNIQSGNTVILTWSSSGASSCSLAPGSTTVSGASGSHITGKLTATTTYNLSCRNNYGTTSASPVTVTVSATATASPSSGTPAILTFFADPARIAAGQTSTLSWVATGIANGGCSLSPSPMNRADYSGSWTTPYLLGSKSYTLTCRSASGQILYASATVTVNDIVPDAAPAPSIDDLTASQAKTFVADTGQTVMNGLVLDSVSGLVTLEPMLFVNAMQASSVSQVKFYEDLTLLETRSIAPFALDTTKLKNGKHPITQRTYYRDGSVGEVTRILGVSNAAVVKAESMAPMIAVAVFFTIAAGIGGGLWQWRRSRPSVIGTSR